MSALSILSFRFLNKIAKKLGYDGMDIFQFYLLDSGWYLKQPILLLTDPSFQFYLLDSNLGKS